MRSSQDWKPIPIDNYPYAKIKDWSIIVQSRGQKQIPIYYPLNNLGPVQNLSRLRSGRIWGPQAYKFLSDILDSDD